MKGFHESAMSYWDAGFWAALAMVGDGRAYAFLGLVGMGKAIATRKEKR